MKSLMTKAGILGLVILLFACSGSRKGSESAAAGFEDAQLQAKAEALQEQIKKNPNNLEYRRQLAELYHQDGKNMEAMKVLEEAMKIDNNDAETKYLYAQIAESAGDKYRAYTAYKAVLQSPDGENYLDRIAPKFMDAFKVEKVVGTPAQEAFGSFSPDGQKIIYQTDQNGNWDIYEYNLADQSTRPVIQSPAHEENPSYSPDGKAIVYTSTEEDHRDVDFDQKRRDIYLMDLESGRQVNLTVNGSDDWMPRFSPDGKYIVFVSQRDDLRDVPFYQLFNNIYIMENDGRFQLRLSKAEAHDSWPCVAPGSTEDEGTIYFDSDRAGSYAIYKMDYKGQHLRQITFNQNVNDVAPVVSPNGDKIVFFSDRDGNYELYLMNDDGSAQQRLTSNPADDWNPVFSPDGQKILFHSNRDGNLDLFIMDLSVQAAAAPVYEVIAKIDKAIAAQK